MRGVWVLGGERDMGEKGRVWVLGGELERGGGGVGWGGGDGEALQDPPHKAGMHYTTLQTYHLEKYPCNGPQVGTSHSLPHSSGFSAAHKERHSTCMRLSWGVRWWEGGCGQGRLTSWSTAKLGPHQPSLTPNPIATNTFKV